MRITPGPPRRTCDAIVRQVQWFWSDSEGSNGTIADARVVVATMTTTMTALACHEAAAVTLYQAGAGQTPATRGYLTYFLRRLQSRPLDVRRHRHRLRHHVG
jgi:hypothetical protein